MALLEIHGLAVQYGLIQAVRQVDLTVETSEIVALLGANGAGKSSTMNAVVGLVPAAGGTITFAGRELGGVQTEEIVRRGVTLVPEGRRVFPSLSVLENLRLGFATRRGKNTWHENRQEAFDLFPILAERQNQLAGTLSGGQQQQLAIARALMSEPELLLMDEPSLGLAPQIVDTIFELIVQLRDRGQTILLVEQNAAAALDIADRVYVLASGAMVMQGPAAELRASGHIAKAYLGEGGD